MTPAFLLLAYGYGLAGYWSLGKFVAVALGGLWLALSSSYRRPSDVWLLAYLAAVAVTSCFSADLQVSVMGLHGTYTSGLVAALVLIPYWASVKKGDRPEVERGMRWAGALFAVSVLVHRFIFNEQLPTGERAYGTMGSPVYAGAALALCLPFCRGWIERLAVCAALWATGSRGAWIAAAVSTLYLHWPRLSRRQQFYSVAVTLAGFFGAFAIRPVSDLGRIIVWDAALEAFKARPWLGWGPGNYYMVAQLWRNPLWDEAYGSTTQDHAHNLLLEAATTGGVILLALQIAVLVVLWRIANRKSQSAILAVGLVGMLNPLPLVVKALCLMISASCVPARPAPKLVISGVKLFSFLSALFVFWLVAQDRLITCYGNVTWAYSSERALFNVGLVKQIVTRQQFRF